MSNSVGTPAPARRYGFRASPNNPNRPSIDEQNQLDEQAMALNQEEEGREVGYREETIRDKLMEVAKVVSKPAEFNIKENTDLVISYLNGLERKMFMPDFSIVIESGRQFRMNLPAILSHLDKLEVIFDRYKGFENSLDDEATGLGNLGPGGVEGVHYDVKDIDGRIENLHFRGQLSVAEMVNNGGLPLRNLVCLLRLDTFDPDHRARFIRMNKVPGAAMCWNVFTDLPLYKREWAPEPWDGLGECPGCSYFNAGATGSGISQTRKCWVLESGNKVRIYRPRIRGNQ
ncbi:hypothetical protein BTUL_0313g00060 [Botrytis tulipae]|uniref:Uncharacterized protein n=1 Tax=Botrytis tulipae TaxID=87230 RepID=A0A4Z1E7J5_9HELO|nr:hypothetical protein BTUL_0313g00060 [Botrytis tulipae]